MKGQKSQWERILEYMQSHSGITSLDAFRLFGETRLSAIIYDLRHMGYKILSQRETGTNRYHKKVSYVRYKLIK